MRGELKAYKNAQHEQAMKAKIRTIDQKAADMEKRIERAKEAGL